MTLHDVIRRYAMGDPRQPDEVPPEQPVEEPPERPTEVPPGTPSEVPPVEPPPAEPEPERRYDTHAIKNTLTE